MDDISPQTIPDASLREYGDSIILFTDARAETELAPGSAHTFCHRLRLLSFFRFIDKHLRRYEFWRCGQLRLDYILPGCRKTIYRGKNYVKAGNGEQHCEVPRVIYVYEVQLPINQLLRRRDCLKVLLKALDIYLPD